MSALRRLLLLLGSGLLLAGCEAWVELEEPRPYRCTRGSTLEPCPDGWRCGLEGYCHPDSAPGPYLCEDQADCAQTWRCGLDGTCHDRQVPDDYACLSHQDCEQGWRCGLEGVCHSPEVATDYLCAGDQHCEQGWRCGPGGRCLDPAQDALRPEASAGPLSPRQLSPQLVQGFPEHLSASPAFRGPEDAGVQQQIAVVSRGNLHQQLYSWRGVKAPDGGVIHSRIRRQPLPDDAGVRDLATLGEDAYLLTGAGLWRARFEGGAPVQLSSVGADRLVLEKGGVDLALLLEDTRFWITGLAEGSPTRGPYALPGGQPIQDLAGVGTPFATGEYLLAAGSRGLYVAYDGGTSGVTPVWHPVSLQGIPHADCGSPTLDGGALRVRRLYSDRNPYVYLETERWEEPGGPAQVAVIYATSLNATGACPASPLKSLLGPCAACPDGGTLMEMTPGGYVYTVVGTRCRFEDEPGRPEREYQQDGGCGLQQLEGRSTFYAERTVAQRSRWGGNGGLYLGDFAYAAQTGFVRAGEHGQLWLVWPSDIWQHEYPTVQPVTLDQLPQSVVAGAAPVPFTGSYGVAGQLGRWEEQGGFVVTDPDGGWMALAEVEGHPEWAAFPYAPNHFTGLLSIQQFRGTPRMLAVAAEHPVQEGPFQATTLMLPDGGTYALVSAFDSLLGADLTPTLRGGPPAALGLRSIPRPKTPIVSLAVLPPEQPSDGGGPALGRGYLLTRSGLYGFRAAGQTRWTVEPIAVPDGEWLEVWTDGARGRLGYSDGTILSLPSRVPLAPPLPGGARIHDFAQLCAQPFALTTDGVYRLVSGAAGTAVGDWVREAMDTPAVTDFSAGRLHVQDGALYVFGAFGTVHQLRSGGCAP